MKKILLLATIAMLSTPAIAADRGKVVATVNGANIYSDSVNMIYKTISADNVKELGGEEDVKKTIINQLSAAEALKQAALKSDVLNSDSFKEMLKVETERLIQEEFLRLQVEKRVTEQKLKDAYNAALKEFKAEMQFDVSNILSKTEEDAKKIIKQLDDGADFAKLAVEKSTASNVSKTKGSLGFLKKSDLIEDIGEEISALKVDGYSKKPVKSPFGWNVFLLKEKKLEKAPKFEDAKPVIQQTLYKQEMMNIIKELQEKADIVIK
jgi:peptidyl-prolyl cis-trans isomerase C